MFNPTYSRKYFDNFLYRVQPYSPRDITRLQTIYQHKKSGSVLELGCGEGYLLKLLEQKYQVKGIEISDYAGGIARKLFDDSSVVIGDLDKIDFGSGSHDVIVAYNILEHLKDPVATLEKIATALKPGGILVGSVPNHQSLVGTIATAVSNVLDTTHLSTLTVEKWRLAFAESGLTIAAEFGEVPIGRNRSIFVKHQFWPHLAFNYIFVYRR